MPFRTVSLTLNSAREEVYNFLANIENVPHWSPRTCESLRILRGRWYALTNRGELVMHLEADDSSGTIELLAGPVPGNLTPLPIRVTALGPNTTLVQMTFIQAAEQSDERYEQECTARLLDLHDLCRRFDGGTVFATPASALLGGPGLN
jgi:hypothetical protein